MSKTSEKSVDLTAKPVMTLSGHEGAIIKIAYLPGGERIVTCSFNDMAVRIWDVENGEQEGTTKHAGLLYNLAVTRDGGRILGGNNARIRVWDVKTHEFIEEWEGRTLAGPIWCIAMSPDDRLAASGNMDGEIVIRDIEEGGQIRHSIDAGRWVHSLCFSPNGEKLVCSVGNTVNVYDVESGELVLGPITAHEDVVNCVLWSLDGSRLFSASDNHTIQCWNSDTGKAIGDPWKSHTGAVYSLTLSPDGTKLASASGDNTVRFWDAHSGDPVDQPLQHDNPVFAVTFSPSGEFVASGGMDKKVSIWRVPWWDDSQKQAHKSLLDRPAIPPPKDRHQGEFDPLDLPTTHRPFISSSRPPVDSTPAPISTRIRRFWRSLVAGHPTSSHAQQELGLQPVPGRRFWKLPAHIPLTEVAAGKAKNGVAVGRRERRRKKRHHKQQDPQAPTGTDPGLLGSSSQPEQSGSTSNTGPPTSQAGPSNIFNAHAAGRRPSFAPSNVGSEDSWDDMDYCAKCLDYFCVRPHADRERFRPWKKKSRAVLEAEKQAKEEKERAKAEKRRAKRRRRRNERTSR
ncbi:hypothetical protein PAXRUDRAFT_834635 [Paxillus rubicundulus Ve08.2h10]|uniref:WD40 repeat-like protein n=1 Tax=Paxillus rubicundulus Ve08.2h10 TaxID=930991 RepID=A0A0D0DJG9_9AGAM|nr:hypothetical protein PAXRUDRAFT_834635 [Paxillus rubicundulus Ve08.2h10]